MDESNLHHWLVWLEVGLAALTLVALLFVDAPYGRHIRRGWGPQIPARVGWVVMESPAVLLFTWIFFQGAHAREVVPLCMLALWLSHYVHRTYIFPFQMRATGKSMPALVAGMAVGFNFLNAYVNARFVSHLHTYTLDWLWDPRFIVGVLMFAWGWRVNRWADRVLFDLRKPGETGYKIPYGGLYRVISCPNYFGEIVMWLGFSIAAWSPAGLAFVVYTIANLGPRALANHRWYHEKFPDYPSERRAIVPFVL